MLYDLAREPAGRLRAGGCGDIISKHLRRIVPASTCVIFVYDVETDDLVAAHASGDNAPHFAELRIPRGQRLTGWVAANKQSISTPIPCWISVNPLDTSDLDLGVASVLR